MHTDSLHSKPNSQTNPLETVQTQPAGSNTSIPVTPLPARRHWRLNRTKTILLAVILSLLLIGGGVAAYLAHKPTAAKPTVASRKKAAPVPTRSNLTGLIVNDASVNQRPVIGVMIENSEAARPQSGLAEAGVVFEAIAEGGITRFLTLFQDSAPDYIGPVRSARPYYVQWCMGFDCALGHVGGSPDALDNISQWGTKDLDQFVNAGAYERVDNRYAPHNVYTALTKLDELAAAKSFGTPSYTPLVRKADSVSKTPTATSVDIAISSGDYNSHYAYDGATNTYKRSQSGVPHMSVTRSGAETQIAPKVVVALVMPYSVSDDSVHSVYGTTGTGKAIVFQDGTATMAVWNKPDTKSSLTITTEDAPNQPLALNAGQTWFVAVSDVSKVSYQ